MFVDAMYYTYFNTLPSIKMIKQIGQLSAVGDSIQSILSFKNILFLVDIPFILLYLKKHKPTRRNKRYNRYIRWGIPSGIAIFLIFLLVFLNTVDLLKPVTNQELFSYHVKDIKQSLLGGEIAEGRATFTQEDLEELKARTNLEEGNYTGIGKDKNLIVIQVEALQNFVINHSYDGQEITPNLNKLIEESGTLYFDRYYQLIGRGNTSDAEFVSNNSLYPSMEEPTYTQYEQNTFYGLPWIFRDNGYNSWVFHGYEKDFWNRARAYVNQGFQQFINQEDFDLTETIGFGISDEAFFKQSMEYLKQLDSIDDNPFYAFMITLTSHTPFKMPKEYQYLNIREEHQDTMLGDYLQAAHYADKALGQFLEDLKETGLYDNSVIALYGDHFAITSLYKPTEELMTDYLGHTYDLDEMMNIPLIIHVPGENINKTISKVGSQMDFMPTILNIMGLKNEKGIMFGRDLANYQGESLVAPQTYTLKGSFIDDEVLFSMSRDGIFANSRAFDLKTRTPINPEKCRVNYEKAINEINKSDFILKKDLIKYLLENDGEIDLDQLIGPYIPNDQYIGDKDYNFIEELDLDYKEGYRILSIDLDKLKEPIQGQISLNSLIKWMVQHKDAYIVLRTQEKDDAIENIYTNIREDFPNLKSRFILEINKFTEYLPLTEKGFKNILLNLSHREYTEEEIEDFINRNSLFGVIIDESLTDKPLIKVLNRIDATIYVDGIESNLKKRFLDKKVYGFFINKDSRLKVDLEEVPPLAKKEDISKKIKNKYLIAHAGGEIQGLTYTNTREALNLSYKNGIRLMEVDFQWTTDGQLVCVHSWDGFINKFFNVEVRQYSYDEFINFNMINGWHQLTPHNLALWLEVHPDAYVVTDIKGDNVEGLKIISQNYPHLVDRIIPQIYFFDEYEQVLALGYENIILTLYRIRNTDEEIVQFARENPLFAITMPEKRAFATLPKRLKQLGIYVYAHTINDKETMIKLMENGVDGFYTDKLRPNAIY